MSGKLWKGVFWHNITGEWKSEENFLWAKHEILRKSKENCTHKKEIFRKYQENCADKKDNARKKESILFLVSYFKRRQRRYSDLIRGSAFHLNLNLILKKESLGAVFNNRICWHLNSTFANFEPNQFIQFVLYSICEIRTKCVDFHPAWGNMTNSRSQFWAQYQYQT